MKPVSPDRKLNLRALSLSEALRAFCAVALPLLVGQVFGIPQLGLAALGALLTCFSDPGGPVPRRVTAVVTYAILGGSCYGFFGWLAGINPYLAASLAALLIFCAGFARVFGQSGLQVGNLTSVAVVLALGYPDPSVLSAILHGCNFWAGAAWAALLTLVIWQTHPHAIARRALGDVARCLAALTSRLDQFALGSASVPDFVTQLLEYRGNVRESIETARSIALQTFRAKGLATPRGAQISLRLESLDQIFGALIPFSELLEQLDVTERVRYVPVLHLIAAWLRTIATEIDTDKPLDTKSKQSSLQHLKAILQTLPETPERHALDAIAEQFSVLMLTTQSAIPTAPSASGPQEQGQIVATIRQNLTWSSNAFRHALRIGILSLPVLAITCKYGGAYAHWAPITLIFCLQPYFAATWVRTAERCGGTILGGVLAAGIGLLVHSDLQLALAMLPLTLCAFALRAVNFGLYIAAITPMIVLLVEQLRPSGESELYVAMSRVLWSLLGGALAIIGSAVLWPGFEAPRLRDNVKSAKAAHRVYVQVVFAALLGQGAWSATEAARRGAGLACNNLEAAIARTLAEPHKKYEQALVKAAAANAALRRMAGRLSILTMEHPQIPQADLPLWQDWEAWLQAALLRDELGPRPALPSGPGAQDLQRLAMQVDLMTS